MLEALWQAGTLSRQRLHEVTGIRPNTVGLDTAALITAGVIREMDVVTGQRGRPAVPLEIDPTTCNVVGLAIEPGRVGVVRLNLWGNVLESRQRTSSGEASTMVAAARSLLKSHVGPATLAVGMSVTGSVDPVEQVSLYGSAWPRTAVVSLQPLCEMIGDRALVLGNDMHALAARWILIQKGVQKEDVLLVRFGDGQFGASLLIEGRPNRGCLIGANELGHTRFPVETERCHCGQSGCLERICSSAFVNRIAHRPGDLLQRAAAYSGQDDALDRMIELVAMGMANAVNFSRVHRLVLVSEMMRYPQFAQAMVSAIRSRILPELAQRVQIELWQQVAGQMAETAGWLGLANLFLDGWGTASDLTAPSSKG